MATVHISEAELAELEDHDFMDELPTEPDAMATVQQQLNAATSVARFTEAAAHRARLAHAPETRPHWTEALSSTLDRLAADPRGRGWAGRTAR